MRLPTPGQAAYLTPLRTEHLRGKWWTLTAPLLYYSALLDKIIETPAGFVTDFASVPRVPVAYWLFGDRANRPAVTHDDLYRSGRFARKIADQVFLEAMMAEGYRLPTRRTMYSMVRMFGRWALKSTPGCLDPRKCPGVCEGCEFFSQEYFDLCR